MLIADRNDCTYRMKMLIVIADRNDCTYRMKMLIVIADRNETTVIAVETLYIQNEDVEL